MKEIDGRIKTVDRINTIHMIKDETVRRPPLAGYLNLAILLILSGSYSPTRRIRSAKRASDRRLSKKGSILRIVTYPS